jgi:hypothetical protein
MVDLNYLTQAEADALTFPETVKKRSVRPAPATVGRHRPASSCHMSSTN